MEDRTNRSHSRKRVKEKKETDKEFFPLLLFFLSFSFSLSCGAHHFRF